MSVGKVIKKSANLSTFGLAFKSNKQKPEEIPDTPDTGSAILASEEERRKQRQAQGRASTVATGPGGLLTEANIGTRMLLGG